MQELYNSVIKLFCQLSKSYKDAMVLCHSWGYNGFKRKYRRRARFFHNWEICLMNELIDKYRMTPATTHNPVPYDKPTKFEEHFPLWDAFLKSSIDSLVGFSKKFIDQVGVENCVLKDALSCLVHDYEKTGRYHKRFDEMGWNKHDMHIVDDLLHAKEKELEEKEGYK